MKKLDSLEGVLAWCAWGPMMCPINDMYITTSLTEWGVYSELELIMLSILNAYQKNSINISIGTNIGSLMVPVAKSGVTVFGYDAQPQMVQFSLVNAKLNNLKNFTVVNKAVGVEGTVQVPSIDLTNNMSNCGAIGRENWGDSSLGELIDVECVSLNSIMDPHMKQDMILHVDVEGMEKDVLVSGESAIRNNKPVVIVEADREDKKAFLYRYLKDLGYRVFWAITPLASLSAKKNGLPLDKPGVVTINWVCWHEAFVPTINGLVEVTEANLFAYVPVIKKFTENFEGYPSVEYWS